MRRAGPISPVMAGELTPTDTLLTDVDVDSRHERRDARRERFAAAIASGMSGADAAREAGYSVVGARQVAHVLLAKPAIRARVDVLLRDHLRLATGAIAKQIAAEARAGSTITARHLIRLGFRRLPQETAQLLADQIECALAGALSMEGN